MFDKLEKIEMALLKAEAAVQQVLEEGLNDEAVELQAAVVDPLIEQALALGEVIDEEGESVEADAEFDDDGDLVSAKPRIRFKRKPPIKGKKFVCCKRPRKSRSRKGKPGWVTSCKWRKGMKKGNKPLFLPISAGGSKQPPKALYATKTGGVAAPRKVMKDGREVTVLPKGKKIPWC
jgi:hypothetical protein